jgi:hypothetical protein
LSVHQDQRFQKLDSNARTIIETLLESRISQSDDLHRHFEELTESQKWEHAKTRAAFVYTDVEKRKVRVQLDLLESLRFPMMYDRYERLAKNHEKTFLWIFKNPQDYQKPWDNFVQWLHNGCKTYWIQGKAASGKSTLMRFIWNNPLTLESLEAWSGGSPPAVAAFFFWNSGIQEQRSHTGLLRSLLYEVLNSRRHLIPDVFREEWDSKSALVAHDLKLTPELWSLPRLKNAFKTLVCLSSSQLKLCFFVDGLDEYEGEPEDIAQYFEDLSHCSEHTKFCVSSRPWPVFQDIYKGTPGLRVQDLTKDDIRLYVKDKLERNNHMQELLIESPKEATSFVDELVEKADGVFLWVVLVVKSLVSGLCNGDGLFHLRSRLGSLPSDLETLYEHMLESIDPLYVKEAAQIFQIFRASGHNLDIATLERGLRYADYRHAIEIETRRGKPTDEESDRTKKLLERAVKRLNSRSKGLLEVVDSNAVSASDRSSSLENQNLFESVELDQDTITMRPLPAPKATATVNGRRKKSGQDRESDFSLVAYLHRTVRDYLEQPCVWNKLILQTKDESFDPETALLMSYVIEVKSTDWLRKYASLYDGAVTILRRARLLKPMTSDSHIYLIEELDRAFTIHWTGEGLEAINSHWSNSNPEWDPSPREIRREWQGDILSMALKLHVTWYIDAKLLPSFTPSATAYRPGLPLLAYALGFDSWAFERKPPKPDGSLVEKFLRHGANPNEIYKGYTIWQYTIHYLHILNEIEEEEAHFIAWLEIFKLMLKHGADPHAYWIEDEDTRIRHLTLKKYDKKGYSLKPVAPHIIFEIPLHIWLPKQRNLNWSAERRDELQHSVTEVFYDVFGKRATRGVDGIIRILEEKKRSAEPQEKKRKRKGKKSSESRRKRKK